MDSRIALMGRSPQLERPMDVAQQGMTMSNLARQGKMQEMQMSEQERANKRKVARELMWQATPDNWAQVRQKGIELGLPNADKVPELFDAGWVNQAKMNLLEPEEQMARLDKERAFRLEERKVAADEKRANRAAAGAPKGYKYDVDPITGETRLVPLGKHLPAETALKTGNLLGAAQASAQLEDFAGKQETGKLASMWDWTKELFGAQDQDRAKFSADVANQRNEVMNRLAGANVTQTEAGRVLEGIPTRSDAPDQFQGKATSTTDGLIRRAEAEIEALAAAGYDVAPMQAKLNAFRSNVANERQARLDKKGKTQVAGKGSVLMPEANASSGIKKGSEIEWAE